jgi:hypothetical protein
MVLVDKIIKPVYLLLAINSSEEEDSEIIN